MAVLAPQAGHAPYVPAAGQGGAVRDLFGNPLPAGQALGETLVYVSAPVAADALATRLGGAAAAPVAPTVDGPGVLR